MFLLCVWLNVRLPLCVFSFPFRSALILLYSNCGVCASGSVSECVRMALLNFFSVPLILFTSNNFLRLTFSWSDRSAKVTAICEKPHHLVYLYPPAPSPPLHPFLLSIKATWFPSLYLDKGRPSSCQQRHVLSLQCHFITCLLFYTNKWSLDFFYFF